MGCIFGTTTRCNISVRFQVLYVEKGRDNICYLFIDCVAPPTGQQNLSFKTEPKFMECRTLWRPTAIRKLLTGLSTYGKTIIFFGFKQLIWLLKSLLGAVCSFVKTVLPGVRLTRQEFHAGILPLQFNLVSDRLSNDGCRRYSKFWLENFGVAAAPLVINAQTIMLFFKHFVYESTFSSKISLLIFCLIPPPPLFIGLTSGTGIEW